MLIEARIVMFPKALIVMCPPGKHGAKPSGQLITNYSMDDIESNWERGKIDASVKKSGINSRQESEKIEERGGKEGFICVSRMLQPGNAGRRA